jgi:hypothetical protein
MLCKGQQMQGLRRQLAAVGEEGTLRAGSHLEVAQRERAQVGGGQPREAVCVRGDRVAHGALARLLHQRAHVRACTGNTKQDSCLARLVHQRAHVRACAGQPTQRFLCHKLPAA